LGAVPASDVALARDFAAAAFGRNVVVAAGLPLPTAYYDAGRRQYDGLALVGYVEANAPRRAYRAVGLSAADFTVGDLNFVFGVSRCPGRAAAISTYRMGFYAADGRQRDLRLAKILVHEVGHAYGLPHCTQPLCIMKFADGYATLDGQRLAFCERCDGFLRRVAAADAAARRARLGAELEKRDLLAAAGGETALAAPPPGEVDPSAFGSRPAGKRERGAGAPNLKR